MREVAHELVAPVRRVRSDDHRADQRGCLEPKDELGHIVEQDGDVKRAVDPPGQEPGRPLGRPGHHVGVAQAEVAGHQAETVIGRAGQDARGDGPGRRAWFRLRFSWNHRNSKRL